MFTKSIKRAREIRKFQVADLKLTKGRLKNIANKQLRNVQKNVMRVQSCCFALLPFSLPSPSLLLKLPIVVIRKCCYHGNVTSHFSSLLLADKSVCLSGFFFCFCFCFCFFQSLAVSSLIRLIVVDKVFAMSSNCLLQYIGLLSWHYFQLKIHFVFGPDWAR